EPSNKRVKPVTKSNSLTGVITPVKTPALKRIGQSISVTERTHIPVFFFVPRNDTLIILHSYAQCLASSQRSISFRTDARPLPPAPLRSRTKASSFPQKTVGEVGPTLLNWLELIQSIVAEVNKKTGEAECQFYRRGLTYLEESQRIPEIHQSRFLYCHGELKTNKGQACAASLILRLHVFLFELALVLTRPGEDRDGGQTFNVYRQPLPNTLINLEEIPDMKNCFRVSSRGRSKVNPYCLQANDSFSKQQWITCLRQAIVQSRDRTAQTSQSPISLHADPALCHIADLSLSSDTDMTDHTSR
ncbi:hypothetical protein GOODEAATRI_018549, partial [Goodea atripinnis]